MRLCGKMLWMVVLAAMRSAAFLHTAGFPGEGPFAEDEWDFDAAVGMQEVEAAPPADPVRDEVHIGGSHPPARAWEFPPSPLLRVSGWMVVELAAWVGGRAARVVSPPPAGDPPRLLPGTHFPKATLPSRL